jgi:hypothetical protein
MSEPKPQTAKIKQTLTPPEGQRLYAVLDGASVPGLLDKLKDHPKQHFSLIAGQLEPDLAAAAPYVVELASGGKLTDWLVEEGWGKHWGLFVFCKREILPVRNHFRMLFEVRDPEGEEMYFRFYDPRVMRVYLPTCTAEELATVFGPVGAYLLEAHDPKALLRLSLRKGVLRKDEVKVTGPA